MAKHSVLVAKIAELEQAYLVSLLKGNADEAQMWNRELIHHLLVLSDSLRDSETPSRSDGGEY
jgi:hypothetical protein